MFFTYLRRELRRRMRQAISIALGLALGIGLVITVTAASNGVKNSQASVLHALYGVGTDLTVTQPPAQGSGGKTQFGFKQQLKAAKQGQVAAGTHININDLVNGRYEPLSSSALATVAGQRDLTSAVGGPTLSDVTVTGTVPAVSARCGGKGSRHSVNSNLTTKPFAVPG